MTAHQPNTGSTNAGPLARSAPRNHNPTVTLDVTGTVRWFDAAGQLAVVHVDTADHHGGRFVDQDVTVAVARAAGPAAGLVPGEKVRVRARLPRDLGTDLPDPIVASHVDVVG